MNRQEMIKNLRDLADWHEEAENVEDALILIEIADTLQKEPNPIKDIVKLNEERYGLSFDMDKEIEKLEEELDEMKEAAKNNDIYEFIDACNDIRTIAIGSIRKAGYDPILTLNEVVKEISSREQDPEQHYRWYLDNDRQHGEKWKKNKSQDPKTLYKADFEKARIK